MGKSTFMDIKDSTGRIQLFVNKTKIGEQSAEVLKLTDLGDLIGVRGELKNTQKGELSIFVEEYTMLTKSILPPPEKWHGLKDHEARYRRRYVDMFANEGVIQTFQQRSMIVETFRKTLHAKNFLEVETPMLHPIPGGASARPFITHHNTLDMQLYMRIAPELYLKRLVVGGLERVFEINRNFRNEGISIRHNPEFTMLELYQAYGNYESMMEISEELIVNSIEALHGDKRILIYQGKDIDFTPPFKRLRYDDLFEQHVGFSRYDEDKVMAKVKELKFEIGNRSYDEISNDLFEEYVEDKLINPTFAIDYPIGICPLTKQTDYDPKLCERFELFANGFELGNAYSELTDPIDQRQRFEAQLKSHHLEENVGVLDEDFLTAMEYGMPPAGGIGLGIDRIVMLLTDSPSIRDVIFFPLMRPVEEKSEVEQAPKS